MKIVVVLVLAALAALATSAAAKEAPDTVAFFGSVRAPISSAVRIPAGRALFMTSGTVPPPVDTTRTEGDPARYGDTRTQGLGALDAIEAQLKERGMTLRDVVYLRVYLTADPLKENRPDFNGWFQAYGARFGTVENPTKPARSTLAVAALVNPAWLIEIEAVAVYPPVKKK